ASSTGRRPGAPVAEASTVPTPVVTPTNASGGPVDETAVLPRVPDEDAGRRSGGRSGVSDAEVTTELPKPPVLPGAADETAVLPPVRGDEQGPADRRAPSGYFRDERPASGPGGADGPDDRTRELPRIDPGEPRRRQRSDWAEETPLDDLPTLADELLGPRDGEHEDGHGDDEDGGRGRRGRRR
ncbi:dTMP kinase, partial [Streptomyces heliomycini]